MNLLIINLDKSIFSVQSKSLADLKDYSQFFGKLFVITWTLGKEEPIVFNDKLFIYPTNSKSRLFYFKDTKKIFEKIIKDEKIDVISTQDPFETGLAGYKIAKKFNLPFHLQIHTDFLSPYFKSQFVLNKLRVKTARFLLKKCNGVRVVSERIKKSITDSHIKLKGEVKVLPIFTDAEKIHTAPIATDLHKRYPQFDFIILMASRLAPEKNIGLAVRVMKEIAKDFPKAGLIIVGSGPEEKKLRSLITHLRLWNNIVMEGWSDDLASYYKTADIFLLTSDYEGYGRTVIESLAGDCPVIMTDVGIAGDVLRDDYNGLVVPVGNKEKLKEAILKMIQNRALHAKLQFSSENIVRRLPNREDYLIEYKKSWDTFL